MTLLEKAREVPARKHNSVPSNELVELSKAWARGEVTLKQAAAALGIKTRTGAYLPLAIGLRKAYTDKKP